MQLNFGQQEWIYPKLVLHRGGGLHAPENTLAALKFATLAKAKMVEFDVKLSADKAAFLFHDDSLDRTTNKQGAAQNLAWQDWQTLDAGSWFDASFAGEKVPLFSDVINYTQMVDLLINIELKPFVGQAEATAAAVADILGRSWRSKSLPLISSFDLDALRAMHRLAPQYPRGILLDDWDNNWQTLATEIQPISMHLNAEILTAERIKQIKAQGLYILAYTVNDADFAQALLEWGVDSICSDNAYLF